MPGNKVYHIFTFTPGFYVVLAFCVLTLPLRWVIGWLIAAVVHELGHYVALRCCGYPITSVQVSTMGAKMVTCGLTPKTECICAIAGPLAGGVLVLLLQWFPVLAVCALVQTLFNLLPIYPLDGGRAFLNMLRLFLPEGVSNFVSGCLCAFVSAAVATVLFYICVQLRYISILVFVIIISVIRFGKTKSSCKEVATAVQ